ncbi:MAG: flagellar basal body P-ring protein FlgI [Synergistales bacterium]|nr:flagellar basal body P-ring protein FlgI [Synergistales bacterium]
MAHRNPSLRWILAVCALLLAFGLQAGAADHPEVRVKDVADVQGVRSNQLSGMGLVVGLQGTGDGGDMAPQMLRNMAERFGVGVPQDAIESGNAAVVMVTAKLGPFVRQGQNIDVQVSAMGDAESLEGGVLLQTPLKAANGNIYAVAQGAISIGGFSAGGQAATVTQNITTVGRVPGGAIVERDVPSSFHRNGQMALLLRQPDFTTAQRLAQAINNRFGDVAYPEDASRVRVAMPADYTGSPTSFVADLERLRITPDVAARVVVNERTGTVVMGGDVRISEVAVAHGNLTVRVEEEPEVSQPQPFGQGQTETVPRTDVQAEEEQAQLLALPASSSVKDLVDALNSVGATPRDIISILQAIKQAGALHGTLEIM